MAKKIVLPPASIDQSKENRSQNLLTPGLAVEAPGSGKKCLRYRRAVTVATAAVMMFGGLFPARSIVEARGWARGLNQRAEAGIDSRRPPSRADP